MIQSPSSPAAGRRITGFTLVELLVVIGIIALLISILLPSLNRARQQAYDVQCKSNLRQLGIGMILYTNEWKAFPGARSKGAVGAQNAADWLVIWAPRVRRALKVSSHKVFTCPTQKDEQYYWKEKSTTSPVATLVGKEEGFGYNLGESVLVEKTVKLTYGYNDWGSADVVSVPTQRGLGGDVIGNTREVRSSAVRSASNLIVLADRTLNLAYGATPSEFNVSLDPCDPQEAPATIHRGGANFLFADGHVEWRRQDEVVLFTLGETVTKWVDPAKPGKPKAVYKTRWDTIAPMWNTDNRP